MPENKLLSVYLNQSATHEATVSVDTPKPKRGILNTLDYIYGDSKEKRAIAEVLPEDKLKTLFGRTSVEHIALSQTGDEVQDWLKEARTAIGLPENHKNILYLEATITHIDRVLNNEWQDIITKAEANKAIETFKLQPVDAAFEIDWWDGTPTADSFTRHERERHSGINGIRGLIYAAQIDGDAIKAGIAIWAYEFPEFAHILVQDQNHLGASVDWIGESAEYDRENHRILHDITFLGCALLYKVKAGDRDTNIQGLQMMGEVLESAIGTAAAKGVPLNITVTPTGVTAVASADDEKKGDTLMSEPTIGELDARIKALEAEKSAQASELSAKQAEIDGISSKVSDLTTQLEAVTSEKTTLSEQVATLTTERDTLTTTLAEKEALIAEKDTALDAASAEKLTATRIAELAEIGEFESDEAKAAMAEKVGTMDDKDYTITKLEHEVAIAKRAKPAAHASIPATSVTPIPGTAAIANAGGDPAPFVMPDNPRAFGRELARKRVIVEQD